MKDVWLFMHGQSDSMSAQIAHHAVAVFLCMLLNGMTDVANKTIGLGSLCTDVQTFFCDSYQLFLLWGCLSAYDEHAGGIAEIAVNAERHVHIDDVTRLQHVFLLGYSVADHLIDARADALWEALVVEAGGISIVLFAIGHADIVDLLGVHSHMDSVSNSVEAACVNGACFTNTFNLLGGTHHIPSGYQFSFTFPIHYFFIKFCLGLARNHVPSSFLLKHFLYSIICSLLIPSTRNRRLGVVFYLGSLQK